MSSVGSLATLQRTPAAPSSRNHTQDLRSGKNHRWGCTTEWEEQISNLFRPQIQSQAAQGGRLPIAHDLRFLHVEGRVGQGKGKWQPWCALGAQDRHKTVGIKIKNARKAKTSHKWKSSDWCRGQILQLTSNSGFNKIMKLDTLVGKDEKSLKLYYKTWIWN